MKRSHLRFLSRHAIHAFAALRVIEVDDESLVAENTTKL
jgi:hypothetical protein